MAIADADTVSLTVKGGDSLWNLLRSTANADLGYSEAELQLNRELFVWILWKNKFFDNFRNLGPGTVIVPKRSVLADVVVLVQTDNATFPKKFFEWTDMDRCADI